MRETSTTIRDTTATSTRTTTPKRSSRGFVAAEPPRREGGHASPTPGEGGPASPKAREGGHSFGPVALLLIAGWAVFAFAGAYRWTIVPILAGAGALAIKYRPRFSQSHRLVDTALWIGLAIVGLQLIPLQPPLRLTLSPASSAIDRALLLNASPNPALAPPRPLSLDPSATTWALLFGAATLLIFWSARAIFERRGGLRRVSRGIVWFGLVMSIVAFVQHSMTPRLIYGFWTPITRTTLPSPDGPFVNRNDLATWMIMAIPLAAGYFMARLGAARASDRAPDMDDIVDARMAWLIASACLMLAALLASTSRSGIVGAAFGMLTLVALGRRRVSGKQLAWMLLGMVLVASAAMMYVNFSVLTARFSDVFNDDLGRGRLTIWRNTLPMARDFWLTGLGVGAFARGMLVYQEMPRTAFFNHAHNQYLQIVVEGGVLLGLAATVTLLAGWREILKRLRADHTPVFWMRAGAASGIAGVAVQNIWDAGLRMPANAVLFAIVAAMALHDAKETSRSRAS